MSLKTLLQNYRVTKLHFVRQIRLNRSGLPDSQGNEVKTKNSMNPFVVEVDSNSKNNNL